MSVIFRGDELIDYGGGSTLYNPAHVTQVADPLGERPEPIIKCELHNEDTKLAPPSEDARIQLASPFAIEKESTVWVMLRFMIPSQAKGGPPPIATSSFLQISQMFAPPFEGVAPWALKIMDLEGKGQNWLCFHRNGKYTFDSPWRRKLLTDHWYTLFVRVKLSESGFVEMWLDGEQLTFWKSGETSTPANADTTKLEYQTLQKGVNDEGAGKNAWMQTVYRQKGSWEPFSIYWDEAIIATTQADLEAAVEVDETPFFASKSELVYATRSSMEVSKPEGKEGDWLIIIPYIELAKVVSVEGATALNAQLAWHTTNQASAWKMPWSSAPSKIKVTWEGGGSNDCDCLILCVRGADPSEPIDVVSVWEEKAAATSSVCPGVTTKGPHRLVVALAQDPSNRLVSEAPAGMTQRSSLDPYAFDGPQAAEGASGTKTIKFASGSVVSAVMTLAIKPPPIPVDQWLGMVV